MSSPRFRSIGFLVLLCLSCRLVMADATPSPSAKAAANFLAGETSPFLKRFANDPVAWRPWGEEAFQRAKEQGKLILLCIGYSSCPWTLKMQLETYRDPAVAAYLNEHFICVLVDREERPDLNGSFMRHSFVINKRSGWPLHCWLTPAGQPVRSAIYLPAVRQEGAPSFQVTAENVQSLWRDDHAYIEREAANQTTLLVKALELVNLGDGKSRLDRTMLDFAFEKLGAQFDPQYGGFSMTPKFHGAPMLEFLLDYASLHRDGTFGRSERAMAMVSKTLRAMAEGAMMDQLGGGFHRYCMDRAWTVPQFEKMLFDQGQLANVYLRAFQATGDPWFAGIARQTLEYVEKELSSGDGGFYCAENPFGDDPKKAGEMIDASYYVWKKSELDTLVGPEAVPVFGEVFGINEQGNLPAETMQVQQKRFPQLNILRRVKSLADASVALQLPEAEVAEKFQQGCRKLLEARKQRPLPQRDEKILPGWNALMISAFLRAGDVLGDNAFHQRAVAAADFTYHHFLSDAYLRPRFSEDYAMMVDAVLNLYESTGQAKWLSQAMLLQDRMDQELWDDIKGGYWDGPMEAHLFLRLKSSDEGSEFCQNATAASNLVRLARTLGDKGYHDRAARIFQYFGGECSAILNETATASRATGPERKAPPEIPFAPVNHIRMINAYEHFSHSGWQFVFTGSPSDAATQEMKSLLLRHARPNSHVLYLDGGASEAILTRFNRSLSEFKPTDGTAKLLICRDFKLEKSCPTAQELQAFLDAEY